MRFLFGECTLDADTRELRRAGRVVHLEPQVFDVLVHLINRRDHVVSKDELVAMVWHGRIVSDSTLSSRVNAARQAIGDSGEEQGVSIRGRPPGEPVYASAGREHAGARNRQTAADRGIACARRRQWTTFLGSAGTAQGGFPAETNAAEGQPAGDALVGSALGGSFPT